MEYEYSYEERKPVEAHPELANKHQFNLSREASSPKACYGEICMEFLDHISRGGNFRFDEHTYSLGAPETVVVEGGYGMGYTVMKDDGFANGMDTGVGMFLDVLSEEYAKQYPALLDAKACGSQNYRKFLERQNPLKVFVPLAHLESYSGMVYIKAVELTSL